MDWLLQNWQTVTALAVVGGTIAIFAVKLLRPRKSRSCGGDCGCSLQRSTRREEDLPEAASSAQARSNSR